MPNEWQSVLDEIKNSVSDMAYNTYFAGKFNFESVDENGLLTITVPSIFIKKQIESKYIDAVRDALEVVDFGYADIEIKITKAENKTLVQKAREVTPEMLNSARAAVKPNIMTANKVVTKDSGQKSFSTSGSGLNPQFRLDNYVVGSNNDLAVSAAKAIIEHPGTRYNPYFLYGGPGCGKTHLVQAIGNEIREQHPELRVRYTTIEEFYHDYVESVRKKIDGFENKYRKSVDVLIIDDFQYIVGKEKSQEEFFHTFNELHNNNKQVIVTCDRLPSELASVDTRLSSRLMQGMPIDIQMPDFETRCAILHMKAELSGYNVDNKTIEYLAENIRSNVRELEGKLNQVAALAEMRNISTSEVIGSMDESSFSPQRRSVSARSVVEKVAKYYSLLPTDLLGKSRTKDIKNARQVAMFLMNDELGMSTVKIGAEFKKDHTTVMHGIKMVKQNLKLDFNLREQISELRDKIYAN